MPVEERVFLVCSSWRGCGVGVRVWGGRLPPRRLINGLSRRLGPGYRQSPAWIYAQKVLWAFKGFLGLEKSERLPGQRKVLHLQKMGGVTGGGDG